MREHAYRAVQVGDDGHVFLRTDLFCDNDEDAKERARQLVDGHAVQLWDGACMLAKFEPDYMSSNRKRNGAMQAPLDRIMRTFGLMVTLTAEQEADARDRLQRFLEGKTGTEQELAVQGLQFLRGMRGRPPDIRRRGRGPVVTDPA